MTDEGIVIKGERLRTLIKNAHRLMRRSYTNRPLWSMVADLTGHGSTISCEICRQAGFQPCVNGLLNTAERDQIEL